jgi:chemotaxis protein methyltransferase WspC
VSGPGQDVVARALAERIGLDVASVGEGLIDRAVRSRMGALGIASRSDYERALLGSGDEARALIEEVVIPESWFFRDGKPFETLAAFAASGWAAKPDRAPLKALSLPCAGGEEPYSIAMTLLDVGLTAGRFRVEAVDVSTRALARAVSGVYGRNSFRGDWPPPPSPHFVEEGGRRSVSAEARRAVHFRVGNLLDPDVLADRAPFDVVFCRNVLIYFDPRSRARAFEALGRLVAEGGLLVLGHADRPDESPQSPFRAFGPRGAFAFRKGAPAVPSRPNEPMPAKATRRNEPKPAPSTRPNEPNPSARPRRNEPIAGPTRRNEPIPEPARRGEPDPGESAALLLDQATTHADRGQYREAVEFAERAIGRGWASGRAHFLLGMIRQASGDRAKAEAEFLRAVYLDPGHEEALLALALLARRKGDVAAEAAYRRRATRVRSRKEDGA